MKKISRDDQKKIMLELLDYIHNLCIANNINYSLCGGSFLGAIRHKGFIPWDDDIDIMLTRENYEKLILLLRERSDYTLLDFQVKNYQYSYAKLCDKGSFQLSLAGEVSQFGLFVDIFPYDHLPESEIEQKTFLKEVHSKNINVGMSNIRTYFGHKSYFKAFCRFFFYYPQYLKIKKEKNMHNRAVELQQFMQQYNHKKTSYIGYVAWNYEEPIKEKFPKEIFEEYSDYLFEGKYYRGIKSYDIYLSQLYGDYMKIPPYNERDNHEYYKWYWRKNKLN